MQATSTMKRFVFTRAGGMAVALIIVTGGVIGITAFAIEDDTSTERAVEAVRVMPMAYASAGQRDRSSRAANPRIVAVDPLQAFTSMGQGEGLIDGANLRVAGVDPVKSFAWDGKVAGLIDGATHPTIQAYTGRGQGEGLVDPANRTSETNGFQAHPSPRD